MPGSFGLGALFCSLASPAATAGPLPADALSASGPPPHTHPDESAHALAHNNSNHVLHLPPSYLSSFTAWMNSTGAYLPNLQTSTDALPILDPQHATSST